MAITPLDQAEKARQALFTAAVGRIGRNWPDFANFRMDHPQNATDRAALARLQATADALDSAWVASRDPGSPQGTQEAFTAALAAWELERFHAAQIFGSVGTGAKKSVKSKANDSGKSHKLF